MKAILIITVSWFSDTLGYLSLKHNFLTSLCLSLLFIWDLTLTAAIRMYAKPKGLRDAILTVGPNNLLPQICLTLWYLNMKNNWTQSSLISVKEGLYILTHKLYIIFLSTRSSMWALPAEILSLVYCKRCDSANRCSKELEGAWKKWFFFGWLVH